MPNNNHGIQTKDKSDKNTKSGQQTATGSKPDQGTTNLGGFESSKEDLKVSVTRENGILSKKTLTSIIHKAGTRIKKEIPVHRIKYLQARRPYVDNLEEYVQVYIKFTEEQDAILDKIFTDVCEANGLSLLEFNKSLEKQSKSDQKLQMLTGKYVTESIYPQ